jgi:hypothetical protein
MGSHLAGSAFDIYGSRANLNTYESKIDDLPFTGSDHKRNESAEKDIMSGKKRKDSVRRNQVSIISLNSDGNEKTGKDAHAKMVVRDAELRKLKSKVVFSGMGGGMGGSEYR